MTIFWDAVVRSIIIGTIVNGLEFEHFLSAPERATSSISRTLLNLFDSCAPELQRNTWIKIHNYHADKTKDRRQVYIFTCAYVFSVREKDQGQNIMITKYLYSKLRRENNREIMKDSYSIELNLKTMLAIVFTR